MSDPNGGDKIPKVDDTDLDKLYQRFENVFRFPWNNLKPNLSRITYIYKTTKYYEYNTVTLIKSKYTPTKI